MEVKQTAIKFNKVSYSYKSDWTFQKFQALKELDLEVFQGESFGFLGHNGAGKTTAIKCLLGLIKPFNGSITIFEQDCNIIESRQSVGYVPEQPYFYDHLTVLEILEMYAALSGVPGSIRADSINQALEMVNLSSRSKSPMRSLSKGLTQRVAMAQAIVNQPKLLVLDEPFSGLDPIGRKEFADLLLALRQQGTTIFMSSHILSDVEFLCRRVSILSHGVLKGVFDLASISELTHGHYELVVQSATDENKLQQSYGDGESRGKFLYFRFSEKEQAENALATAIKEGVNVESYKFLHGTLEDLFVELVQKDSVDQPK